MFFETLENDIKNRLTAKVGTGIDVEVLPEKQSEFARPFTNSRISVCYKMSDYASPKSTGQTVQEEDIQVELVINARNLRGTNGVYDTFNKARKALIGYKPTHCGRIYGVSFKFETREDALWTYVFTIACKSNMVMIEDAVSEPGATSLGFNNTDPGYPGTTVTS